MERLLRKSVMVLMALALALGAWGRLPVQPVAAATCQSATSGNWNSPGTWTNCGGNIPQTGDTVEILNGHTVTLSENASVGSAGSVIVKGGGILNLAQYSLTAGTLSIEDGGEVQQGGSSTAPSGTITTRSYATNSTYTFNGTQAGLSGTHPTYGNLKFAPTPTGNGTFAVNLTVAGDLTIALGNSLEVRFATGSTARTHSIGGDLNIQSGTIVGNNGSAESTISIGGDINVTGGIFRGTNDSGNANFKVKGNITSNGGTWQLDDGSSTGSFSVTCEGSSQQIGGIDTIRVDNLAVNSGATLTILNIANLSVAATLTNNGALKQTLAVSSGTVSFLNISTDKYYGVDITTTGNMGDTTVTVWGNQACAGTQNTVLRCFDISPTTPQGAEITLYYRDAEENGQTAANIWHFSGGNWVKATDITRGGSGEGKWVRGTVTAFSPFTLSNNNPLAVDLTDFSAVWDGDAVAVSWETAQELDNLGFNLYRGESAAGPWTRLNAELIPTQNPGAVFGATYTWLDENVTPGATYFYRLEDVDIYGVSTFHGPVSTAPVDPSAVALSAFGARGPAFGLPLALAALGLWGLARKRRS